MSIDGKRVNDVPAKDRDIAMVFQSYALYPHMSVFDNLAFGLRRRDVAAGEIDKRVRNVAATLGLGDLLKRKPHALSGGQRQRVALGRAIVRDPKVFLFDEPLSNLDAALRVGMRGELIKLHHRLGATMIYVTHDQVEAMTMGDRICIMNGGKVVQIGSPLDVYRDPADMFVASFLGSPPTNLLPGLFNGSHLIVGQAKLPVRRNVDAAKSSSAFARKTSASTAAAPHAYGEVLAVEPLGAETIVRFRLPDVAQDVLVRGPRSVVAKVGERAPVAFDSPPRTCLIRSPLNASPKKPTAMPNPPALMVRRHFPRPAESLVNCLRDVPTGWVVDANGRRGAVDYRVRPLTQVRCVSAEWR